MGKKIRLQQMIGKMIEWQNNEKFLLDFTFKFYIRYYSIIWLGKKIRLQGMIGKMINWQNDKKFLLDYIYLMYHVARIINIRTDITDKHMMTSIMVIEIWPSPSDVTSDFSRIICPFFRMLFLVSTSTLIWFPVKKSQMKI